MLVGRDREGEEKSSDFPQEKVNLMAAVNAARQSSRISMSVSMSLVQGQGGAAAAPQAILAAATAAPYFSAPAVPQDVQPDRPIGYGAFGVVW